MLRFLLILIMACAGALQAASTTPLEPEISTGSEGDQSNDEKVHPRKPQYSPVYCCIGGDEITVYCLYEAIGEITVSDSSGMMIATATGELSGGYSVVVPGGITPGMTIRVTVDTHSYSATL